MSAFVNLQVKLKIPSIFERQQEKADLPNSIVYSFFSPDDLVLDFVLSQASFGVNRADTTTER